MRLRDYTKFVKASDWTKEHSDAERLTIARYGIASEIGSLAAALKKKMLIPSSGSWNVPTEEIVEELGDVLWYATMLAYLTDEGSIEEVVKADLEALPREIREKQQFKDALPDGNFEKFAVLSASFLQDISSQDFSAYQKIAILTARTAGKALLDVCITRLLLYATSIMSRQFPEVEFYLKDDIIEFSAERTLGMVMWHLSAIATLYELSLNKVAEQNFKKLDSLFNLSRQPHTPLHDEDERVPASQRFPRRFSIAFVAAGRGRLQMYFDGKPLGDEIDDNSDDEDGYRFHDVMHLSNAAKLGWSPVLRALMGRKRKFDPVIDRNQDGARAQIVEEAVVKAIHSEGKRIGQAENANPDDPMMLFTSKDQIPFSFLKLIKTFVDGLEVEKNTFWEWQEAILAGHSIYANLLRVGQGTVSIDLHDRSIEYSPHVRLDARASLVAAVDVWYDPNGEIDESALTSDELELNEPSHRPRLLAQKRAIANILGFEQAAFLKQFSVTQLEDGVLSVRADPEIQEALWKRGVLGFRSYASVTRDGEICCVNALGKPT